jgi:predicted RNase H-like HicB family nuclease
VIVRDEDWYVAWAEELPGANTQGRTVEEAKANLKEAIQLILEARREADDEELAGQVVLREPVTVSLP